MKVGSKKWHLVVPVHQSNSEAGGRFTDYMIAKEFDAPDYEQAVEEVEDIAEELQEEYYSESGITEEYLEQTRYYSTNYDRRGKMWRIQEAKVYEGTKFLKYI